MTFSIFLNIIQYIDRPSGLGGPSFLSFFDPNNRNIVHKILFLVLVSTSTLCKSLQKSEIVSYTLYQQTDDWTQNGTHCANNLKLGLPLLCHVACTLLQMVKTPKVFPAVKYQIPSERLIIFLSDFSLACICQEARIPADRQHKQVQAERLLHASQF